MHKGGKNKKKHFKIYCYFLDFYPTMPGFIFIFIDILVD